MSATAIPAPQHDLPAEEDAGEAVFAGGCFWCTEAVFAALDGVSEATPGYAGGSAETADYETVCGGATDHAEAVCIRYDPARISYGRLLQVFFGAAHDPTQLDRQGPDRGRQYRSAIFYADAAQRRVAEAYIDQLERSGVFGGPLATTLEPLEGFYQAEAYHQDFVANNPAQPYVCMVAQPKLDKLWKMFPEIAAPPDGGSQ